MIKSPLICLYYVIKNCTISITILLEAIPIKSTSFYPYTMISIASDDSPMVLGKRVIEAHFSLLPLNSDRVQDDILIRSNLIDNQLTYLSKIFNLLSRKLHSLSNDNGFSELLVRSSTAHLFLHTKVVNKIVTNLISVQHFIIEKLL